MGLCEICNKNFKTKNYENTDAHTRSKMHIEAIRRREESNESSNQVDLPNSLDVEEPSNQVDLPNLEESIVEEPSALESNIILYKPPENIEEGDLPNSIINKLALIDRIYTLLQPTIEATTQLSTYEITLPNYRNNRII